ncbi:MAG: hypothetical protein QXE84_08775 [Candidatus Nitrosotenuis sp.]
MVWFILKESKNQSHRKVGSKSIKKFLKGEPDWEYFGGGMYANYFSHPLKRNMRAYEVFPTLKEEQRSLEYLVTDAPRSFELCKKFDESGVRLVIRSLSGDIESYAKSLNVEYHDTGMPILPIISKNSLSSDQLCLFFDFELDNQFNFTGIDTQQKPIIDKLIRVMNVKNCAVLIQFLFTTAIKWNTIAADTATSLDNRLQKIDIGKIKSTIVGFRHNFVPVIHTRTISDLKGRSSSIYNIGKQIQRYYHEKTSSLPISLAIRGMIIGKHSDIALTVNNIASVFGDIAFSNDFLRYCDYRVDPDLAYSWLVNNEIASDRSIEILQRNQKMWNDMRWGINRDFVPFLCLSPSEFSVFVSLPSDSSLPILFRRRRITIPNLGMNLFALGTTDFV